MNDNNVRIFPLSMPYLNTLVIVLFLLLLVSPAADFISVFSRFNDISIGVRFSLFFRLLILITLIILCVMDGSNRKPVLWCFFWIGILIHLLLVIINSGEVTTVYMEGILTLIKFHLFFLYLGGFIFSLALGVRFKYMLKVFYIMIGAYSSAIVLGAVLNIEIFQYYSTERWGVKGIIIAGNEVSGFLIAALGVLLVNKRTNANLILLFLVSLAMALCGTKAALLGLIMVFSGHFYASGGFVGTFKILGLMSFAMLAGIVVYQSNVAVQDAIYSSLSYFEYQLEHYANGSYITLLLSGRDLKLEVILVDILDVNIFYLFTGGYPISDYMIEMDLFDYIALSGIIGAAVYFYYWVTAWNGLSHGYVQKFVYCFIVTYIILGFLGGHMFHSAVAAPFLAFMVLSSKRRSDFPDEY